MRDADEAEMISAMRMVRIAKEELQIILNDPDAALTANDVSCLRLAIVELDGALTSLDSVETSS